VIKRIVLGLVLTVVLLGIARRLSTRNPRDINVEEGGVRVNHTTVTEQVGPGEPVISVRIEPADGGEPGIDFGQLGVLTSSAQITRRYGLEELVGSQVLAVTNFPPRKIAGFSSQVLVDAYRFSNLITNGVCWVEGCQGVLEDNRYLGPSDFPHLSFSLLEQVTALKYNLTL